MLPGSFISIDQNSHVLWDTVPKLQALTRHGWSGTHCIEDVDVAFTRQGAAKPEHDLELTPERYYRTGNSDWGAALFYSEFLGRNPINSRVLESYTGLSTVNLARRLGLTVDGLYERYAGSDNWQLIGTSYVGDHRHHRVIGDLTVAETGPYLRLLLEQAHDNLIETFPETAAQQRIGDWYAAEAKLLDDLLRVHAGGSLVELYTAWTRQHVPETVCLSRTSAFFASDAALPRQRLLPLFLQDYARCAGLYNAAVQETACGLKPLQTEKGELPFFAVWRLTGAESATRMLRTGLNLIAGKIVAGDREWPLPENSPALPLEVMERDGLICVCGKAILLVLQARLMPGGAPLALPYNGSLYLPAAWAFEAKLRAAGLLPWLAQPVIRVRFAFLRHWADCATVVRLPAYLAGVFSALELPASRFATELPAVLRQARQELDEMTTADGRARLLAHLFPAETAKIPELEARRRELARSVEGRPDAGKVWDAKQAIERQLLQAGAERALRNLHVLNLDYWDSRGAILPWAVALGGAEFYDRVLEQAEIYEETAG